VRDARRGAGEREAAARALEAKLPEEPGRPRGAAREARDEDAAAVGQREALSLCELVVGKLGERELLGGSGRAALEGVEELLREREDVVLVGPPDADDLAPARRGVGGEERGRAAERAERVLAGHAAVLRI